MSNFNRKSQKEQGTEGVPGDKQPAFRDSSCLDAPPAIPSPKDGVNIRVLKAPHTMRTTPPDLGKS